MDSYIYIYPLVLVVKEVVVVTVYVVGLLLSVVVVVVVVVVVDVVVVELILLVNYIFKGLLHTVVQQTIRSLMLISKTFHLVFITKMTSKYSKMSYKMMKYV